MRIGAFAVLTLAAGVTVCAAQTVSGSSNTSVSSETSANAQSGAAIESKSSVHSSHEASVSGQDRAQEKPTTHKDSRAQHKSKGQASSDATANANIASGTTIKGVLAKSVDSRKAKAGDQVVLKATEDVKSEGKVVVPKGSKIYGHVTDASTKAEGKANSSLAIVFDRAELKNGSSVALNTVVQAIAQGQQVQSSAQAEEMMSASGNVGASPHHAAGAGGGLLRSVGTTAGSATSNVTELGASAGSMLGGTISSGTQASLSSTSSGVVGLQGLALYSELSSATNGSVITSPGKSVHLDSGTQFLLRAQ